MIQLSASAEPEIYRTTRTFGTILENVVIDERGVLDLDDDSKTENTRAAYKLEEIANAHPEKRAGHPSAVVMLTADAFGILPPIARLDRTQALYYFLSGFTVEARRHRDRHHRAAADVLDVLRRAVPAAAAARLRRDARAQARRARLRRLAREHGLDRRAVRRGRAHADRCHARPPARRAVGTARRTSTTGTDQVFGFQVPVERPGRRPEAPRPAHARGAIRRGTTRRRSSWRGCSRRTSRSSRRTPRARSRSPGRESEQRALTHEPCGPGSVECR